MTPREPGNNRFTAAARCLLLFLSTACAAGLANAGETLPPQKFRLRRLQIKPAKLIEFRKPSSRTGASNREFDRPRNMNTSRSSMQEPEALPRPLARPLKQHSIVDDVDVGLTPIDELNIDASPKPEDGNRLVPADFAGEYFRALPEVHYGPAVYHKHFAVSRRSPASAFAYGPVYFEHRNLERHGRSYGRLQPLASAAHFFLRVPALPYLAAAEPPWRASYPSDPYPAGRPAPRVREWPEFRVGAASWEAGLAVGLVFLLP